MKIEKSFLAIECLFVNVFALEIVWQNKSFDLLDSHSRYSNGNPAIDGTVILSKFKSLLYIDKYFRKMYLEKKPISAYFQIHFIRVVWSMEDISNIQDDLKREKQRKYQENLKKNKGKNKVSWKFTKDFVQKIIIQEN